MSQNERPHPQLAGAPDEATLIENLIESLIGTQTAGSLFQLGDGVWGRTFAIGDDHVVKLIRRKGGIGEGPDIWQREVDALHLLNRRHGTAGSPLPIPQILGEGRIGDDASAEFCAWILLPRLPGTALHTAIFEAWPVAQQHTLAEQLGAGLAYWHEVAGEADSTIRRAMPTASRRMWILDAVLPDLEPADRVTARQLKARLTAALTSGSDRLIHAHGDVNSTNLLVSPSGRLEALIDFAEAGWDLPEVELAHWRTLGWPWARLAAAYEEAGGRPMQPACIHLYGAINALIGLALDSRTGDRHALAAGRAALNDCLEALAGAVP